LYLHLALIFGPGFAVDNDGARRRHFPVTVVLEGDLVRLKHGQGQRIIILVRPFLLTKVTLLEAGACVVLVIILQDLRVEERDLLKALIWILATKAGGTFPPLDLLSLLRHLGDQ